MNLCFAANFIFFPIHFPFSWLLLFLLTRKLSQAQGLSLSVTLT